MEANAAEVISQDVAVQLIENRGIRKKSTSNVEEEPADELETVLIAGKYAKGVAEYLVKRKQPI